MKKLQVLVLALMLAVFASSVVYADETGGTQEGAVRISRQEAEKRAFKDAGVSAGQVHLHSTELENEHGKLCYEIEFTVGATEYDYHIDAARGTILKRSYEVKDRRAYASKASAQPIDEQKAKQIAISHAGVNADTVSFKECKMSKGVWKIKFFSGSAKYEYELNAATGAILEHEYER